MLVRLRPSRVLATCAKEITLKRGTESHSDNRGCDRQRHDDMSVRAGGHGIVYSWWHQRYFFFGGGFFSFHTTRLSVAATLAAKAAWLSIFAAASSCFVAELLP
jgi:hypothetical protein